MDDMTGGIAPSPFRRQHPVGQYVVDFVCLEKALVIVLDGGHHSQRIAYDAERTALLATQGFQVLRFWDNQVLREMESVKTAILEALESPPSQPSPSRGKEYSEAPIYLPTPVSLKGEGL